MVAMASQITSLTIVYSTVCSDADQRKHESSASLAFVWGIHRGPVNSPHKWPVTRKSFPFHDVVMFNVNQCCGVGIEFLVTSIFSGLLVPVVTLSLELILFGKSLLEVDSYSFVNQNFSFNYMYLIWGPLCQKQVLSVYRARISDDISEDTGHYSPMTYTSPDSKVHGANMGPTWVLSAPGGPHVCPINLAIRVYIWFKRTRQCLTFFVSFCYTRRENNILSKIMFGVR